MRIETNEFRDAFLAGDVEGLRKKYGVDVFKVNNLDLGNYNGNNLDGLKGISVGGYLDLGSYEGNNLDELEGISVGGNLNLGSYEGNNLDGLKGISIGGDLDLGSYTGDNLDGLKGITIGGSLNLYNYTKNLHKLIDYGLLTKLNEDVLINLFKNALLNGDERIDEILIALNEQNISNNNKQRVLKALLKLRPEFSNKNLPEFMIDDIKQQTGL